jgi:hypothetical protein
MSALEKDNPISFAYFKQAYEETVRMHNGYSWQQPSSRPSSSFSS